MIEVMRSHIIKRAEYANCVGKCERRKIVQELLIQCSLVNVCMPSYYIGLHTDSLGIIDSIYTESATYGWSDEALRFIKTKGGGESFVNM